MFRGAANSYDEPVAKTTDENLTAENWELILNLCDKVTDEGETGARDVIAAVLKRLTHRNPNVQLYSLTLVEALSKNCGIEINREIASRSFTQGLERLVTDRTTHDRVKKRTLALIRQWAGEFENDPSLGIMEETYDSLKAKNFRFDQAVEPPPPEVDDSLRRKEEEELQRVLEISLTDKGGRDRWYANGYAAQSSSIGAGSSRNGSTTNLQSSSSAAVATSSAPAATSSKPAPPSTASKPAYSAQAAYSPPVAQPATPTVPSTAKTSAPAGPSRSGTMDQSEQPLTTRVRALHNFEPTEIGELAFEKGDIIKVIDRGYKDWWKGQLKGKSGIFPVNYVEPIPEPTAADIAKEVQMEAEVFSQGPNIDKLLAMLRGLDPLKDNLADNDELQELYRQSMALRPKIVKLIDKYTQKRIELSTMSDNFKTARQMFETMMEESMAKHSPGVLYDYRQARQAYDYGQTPSVYGWNPSVLANQGGAPRPGTTPPQPGFPGYQNQGQPQAQYQGPPAQPPAQDYVQPYGPAPQVDPHSAYAQQQGYQYGPQQQPPPAVYQPQQPGPEAQQPQGPPPGQQPPQPQQQPPYAATAYQQQYPGYAQQPQGPQPVQQHQQQPQQPQQQPQQALPAAAQQQYQQQPSQPGQQPQAVQAHQQPAPAYEASGYPTGPTPGASKRQSSLPGQGIPPQQGTPVGPGPMQAQPRPVADPNQAAPVQAQPQAQPVQQQQPGPQPIADPYAQAQAPAQAQPQVAPVEQPAQQPQQAQPQQQQVTQPQQGPPYVWSPNGTYPDPGAQAWAQYYAMGGTDPAGRVYFTPESLPPEGSIPPGVAQAQQAAGATAATA
ncbi:ESCRT-0 subunit protein hse1 [Tulasnella sp. 403]|nr:ESCRT-0 subunit protein hse1 [Tulasnella sp. 403]